MPQREPYEPTTARRPIFLRGGFLGFLLVVVAFGAFAAVVWIAYEEGVKSGAKTVIPIVRAEKEPVKVRPEQPGGMDVPFQDKLVYEGISEGVGRQETTHVTPPPEAPVAPPAAAVETEAAVAAAPPKTEVLQLLESEKKAAPEVVAIETSQPPQETAPRAAEKAVEPVGKPFRVQLVALRSEAAAQAFWSQHQKSENDLLGALTLHVERAELGERGTFFRVQAGPLADEAAATALCTRLQQRKIGCLVVRP